jgi:DNA-binding XRE family transcriptional regulator
MYDKYYIMINIIYGLRDPRNDVYQYIGKSTVGTKRALQHLTQSHSPKVNEWVSKLNENWLYPIVDVIEEIEDVENLPEREKYWVNYYYDINPSLLNIQLIDAPLQNIRSEEDENKFNFLSIVIQDAPKILKKERLCRNLTQDELAKEMGVARSTVSLCENGANVNLKTIQDYIRTLKGIDIIRKSYNQRATRIL